MLLILSLILGLGLSTAEGYSSKDLLTWMQASNFGYQVLQQALNDNQSATASEMSCLAEVRLLLQGAEGKSLPALRVLDAWGKFPQGLLYGHFMDMGNYESCLSLDLNKSLGSSITIKAEAKYCLSRIQFESLLLEAAGADALTLSIGTCIPSSCSAAQLSRWLQGHLQDMFGENSTGTTLVQEQDCALSHKEPMNGLDWFAVSILILLCTLVLLATILDYGEVSIKLLGTFSHSLVDWTPLRYFLHHQGGRKSRLPKWLAFLLWILSLSLVATVIFAVYPYTQDGVEDISPLAGAFYLCCSRIAWPLALCWIIWACQNGLAPIINDFLSWTFWQPLSKISYCLYIWHLLVETVHIARIKTSLHFSDYDAILRFWSDFGITLLVSLFMHLFVEVPLGRLELELLRSRKKPEVKSQPPEADNSSQLTAIPVTSISRQNLVDP
uniref:Uncharacterized protein LOC108053849 n=1 Tax=Drosophila rhopaloa TaxID=1041015 RepID=A0A6P4FRH3_DRORH